MNRSVVRPLVWLSTLAAAAAGLRLAASGDLGSPPLSPGTATDWAGSLDPTVAALALVRTAAEVTCWYLLALSLLDLAGRRAVPCRRLAGALGLPWAQRVVHAGLGAGLMTAAVTVDASPLAPVVSVGASAIEGDDPAAARPADASSSVGTAMMRPLDREPEVPSGTATMRPLDRTPTPAPAPPTPATPTRPGATVADTWTVVEGESFWTIAADLVADNLGREPSDDEVDPVWRALIDANRHRLVDPDDVDLVLPGQVLEIPPSPI